MALEPSEPLERQLRPEARPLDWKSLDPEQKNAFREVVSWLDTAVRDLRRRNSRERLDRESWLDTDRSSRILMLSGERGSGKTTALLSVIQACLHFRREGGAKPSTDDYPADLREVLPDLSTRLVWLEPIDMEPLPKSVNLLAAILSRIEATVKPKPAGDRRHVGAELDWWGGSKDPLLSLMRLQTDVALTWEGNLGARGGHLDPDVYATEVMRAERARLMLNRRISDLLDDIADSFFRSKDLLFVLPIDDCDLSPALAVPILRVLRMISVPRLFTIVLGDEPMARTVFRLKYQGELIEAAAPTGTTGADTWPGGYRLGGTADQVGLSALRKLLPPGQRIYLRPMRVRTALEYTAQPGPPRAEQLTIRRMLGSYHLRSLWQDSGAGSEQEFLDKLPLKHEDYTRVQSIIDIIDTERVVFVHEPGQRSRRQSAYSGRTFFRQPARRVLDLWAKLYGIHTTELSDQEREEGLAPEAKRLRLLLNYLAEQALQAVDEDFELLEDERLRLTRMIDRNWEGDYELDANYLELLPPPWDQVPTRSWVDLKQVFSTPVAGETTAFAPYLACQQVKDWFLQTRVLGPGGNLDRQEIRASRPVRAALTLFSDYVAMHDRERLSRGSIRPNPLQLRCAAVRWIATDGSLRHEVYWPAPDWESLWPYDLLTSWWSEAVRWVPPRVETDKNRLEFFAFVWILACTCLVSRVLLKQAPGTIPPSEADWKGLAEAVARLVPLAEKGRTHRHIRSWLLNLAALLAPECGLPSRIAGYFEGLYGFWQDHAEEVRSSRARVIRLGDLVREKSPAARNLAVLLGARTSGEHTPPRHPINEHDSLRPRLFEEREAQ